MSSLGVLSESPIEDNDDHSHFFAHSDDDADTASQKSISLSSSPSSPSKRGFSTLDALDASLATPIKDSFLPHTNLQSDVQFEDVTLSPTKGAFSPMNDFDTTSIPETGSNSPSVATSFKFEEDGTRPSSMSSDPSLFREEDPLKNHYESLSTALPQTSPPLDRHESEASSVYSAKTGDSSTTGGKKARPESKLLETNETIILGIALVDFNHIIGPRVEFFEGSVFEDEEIIRILPFLALPDGAHLSNEDYSYFHLVPSRPKPSTLFGISCNRQIASSELASPGDDVTRSTVQKAVVILASKPVFGAVRDKLGVVTEAFFNQRDFREVGILIDFYSSLEVSVRSQLTESGLYMGTSLRELVHKFRYRTLVLLKALILQKKIMFYGHPVHRLCTYQYSLVTLIPALLQTLDDCGSPPLNARAPTLSRPSSLKTSDRKSLLAFAGLPLDIFGRDAFFQPYLPLQQTEIAKETNSWLCGCTNEMVYNQSDYDLLVNIESSTIGFKDPRLEKLLGLTPPDRKWIDDIVRDVNEGWDDNDSSKPTGIQFKGSDDYLRTKFEEYICAALATIKYTGFLAKNASSGVLISEGYDPVCQDDFGRAWISAFKTTNAFDVWDRTTDPLLFDIVEPRHPCIDKPSAVTDIGLQITESFRDLRLDQQLAPTREAISNAFAAGSANVLKTVDGLKGRWNARRTLSSPRSQNFEEGTAEIPTASTPPLASPPLSEPSTPTPQEKSSRPTSLTAAANEARTTIGSWGTGIGSFFSQRAARFSLSRNSSVTSLPPPPVIRIDPVPNPVEQDEPTPTFANNLTIDTTGHHSSRRDYPEEEESPIEISHGIAS